MKHLMDQFAVPSRDESIDRGGPTKYLFYPASRFSLYDLQFLDQCEIVTKKFWPWNKTETRLEERWRYVPRRETARIFKKEECPFENEFPYSLITNARLGELERFVQRWPRIEDYLNYLKVSFEEATRIIYPTTKGFELSDV